MVERRSTLDSVFFSLSDATRRDMLELLREATELSIGEIASHYRLTFGAIAKHLKVLEDARLVVKRRFGKQQLVSLQPETAALARDYLNQYACLMNERFDRLDALITRKKK